MYPVKGINNGYLKEFRAQIYMHVKQFAKDNNISYSCAVSMAKSTYVKKVAPKKEVIKAKPQKKKKQEDAAKWAKQNADSYRKFLEDNRD